MKSVVVTGAGGLVGRHAVQLLRSTGWNVITVYRRDPVGHENGPHVQADLRDPGGISLLDSIDAEVLVHCAAVIPESDTLEEDRRAADSNRRMDEAVVEHCHRLNRRLVYLSTIAVYGSAPLPWIESGPAQPSRAYGTAKLSTEQSILERDLRGTILRLSSPFGRGQRFRTVLKIFIENALSNADLKYHGSGERQQDFISAEDVAQAISLAASRYDKADTANIASGKSVSMKELAKIVIESIPETKSRSLPSGIADPQEAGRVEVDIHKARILLGWRPVLSLAQAIRSWALQLKGKM